MCLCFGSNQINLFSALSFGIVGFTILVTMNLIKISAPSFFVSFHQNNSKHSIFDSIIDSSHKCKTLKRHSTQKSKFVESFLFIFYKSLNFFLKLRNYKVGKVKKIRTMVAIKKMRNREWRELWVFKTPPMTNSCLLYTSDAADE